MMNAVNLSVTPHIGRYKLSIVDYIRRQVTDGEH